jgi:hypothetical protein
MTSTSKLKAQVRLRQLASLPSTTFLLFANKQKIRCMPWKQTEIKSYFTECKTE